MLKKKELFPVYALFAAFILYTILIKVVNVKPLGPDGSSVGFAGINAFFLTRLSFSRFWYVLSVILGDISIAIIAVFGLTGLQQLISRRSLWKVDTGILLLGCFYILVGLCYVLFEKLAVNLRPVLMDGELEASYPSSHTVLALCVLLSAPPRLGSLPFFRAEWKLYVRWGTVILAVLAVLTRFLSGAHWFTDIIGGLLLSAALLTAYRAADRLLVPAPGRHEKH